MNVKKSRPSYMPHYRGQLGAETPVLQHAQFLATVSMVSTWMGAICTDRVGHSMLDCTYMQISESGLLTLGQCEGSEDHH